MKISKNFGLALLALLCGGIALAEDGSGSTYGAASGLIALAASIAVGLGTFGAASGQGKATAAALEGIARNPNSRADVFTPFILGLAFMEFQAIMGFLIAFLLLNKV